MEDQFEVFIFFVFSKKLVKVRERDRERAGKKKDEEKKYSEVSEVK